MRIQRFSSPIIVLAAVTAPLLAACGGPSQAPTVTVTANAPTTSSPTTSSPATSSPATSTLPQVSSAPPTSEAPTVTTSAPAAPPPASSKRPQERLPEPGAERRAQSADPGFPDFPAEDPGPTREWARYGPHPSMAACEQAKDRWPDITSECFTVDGEMYFYGMRQATS